MDYLASKHKVVCLNYSLQSPTLSTLLAWISETSWGWKFQSKRSCLVFVHFSWVSNAFSVYVSIWHIYQKLLLEFINIETEKEICKLKFWLGATYKVFNGRGGRVVNINRRSKNTIAHPRGAKGAKAEEWAIVVSFLVFLHRLNDIRLYECVTFCCKTDTSGRLQSRGDLS